MSPRARARLVSIILVMTGLALAGGFALYGLSGKITYFHTPGEIINLTSRQLNRAIRVGGLVKPGSLRSEGETRHFIVTDNTTDLAVSYRGILPDLFREGQSVITYGHYDTDKKLFVADQILAKHDENYMPPEIEKAMRRNLEK